MVHLQRAGEHSASLSALVLCTGRSDAKLFVAWRRADGIGNAIGRGDVRCAPDGASTLLARFAARRTYEVVAWLDGALIARWDFT